MAGISLRSTMVVQIIAALKKHEAGARTADLALKHRISEAKRLKALTDGNARLKKLLVEQILDASPLRELLTRK